MQKNTPGSDRMPRDDQKNIPDAKADGVGGVGSAVREVDGNFGWEFFCCEAKKWASKTKSRACKGSVGNESALRTATAKNKQDASDAKTDGSRCRIDEKWAYLWLWWVVKASVCGRKRFGKRG